MYTQLEIQEEMNYITHQLQNREISLDEYYTLYSELEDQLRDLKKKKIFKN